MGDSAKNKPSFFAGVKAEFKKINWPYKEDITKQTVAVVCTTVVLGIVIALLDTALQYGVNLLSL